MTPDPLLEASNVLAWILTNAFVNEYNKPLEFKRHAFLIDYMVDNHPIIVTKKAAQVGMTVAEALKSFHLAAYKRMNIIHVLHTDEVIKGFVAPKINPIIEYNPKIKQLVTKDSESLKQVADNFIFYRGAQSEAQAVNVTADVLLIDEYDRCKSKVAEMYASRLSASDYRWRRYFSNPTAINSGVDGLYNQSDQRHWLVPCRHCQHWGYMDFAKDELEKNHYVDIEKGIYACGKCGQEITDQDRIDGEWVAKYPGKDIHGYWFSQLMAPWMSAKEILLTQQTTTVEYFHNFVLGKAYTPTDLIVNREKILRATKPANYPKTRVAIGVDNGQTKHWVAATPDGVFDYGKTEDWLDIEKLLLMYNATMVIDALPDFTIPRQLVDKYKGRVFVNYYVPDTKNLGVVRWGKNEDFGVVKTDRTKAFDRVASMIGHGQLLFRQSPVEMDPYISHWENVFRTKEIDEKTGIEKGSWQHHENRPDHWCFDGNTLVKTRQADVKIKDVRVGDFVLTSKGYRKVTRAWLTKKNAKVCCYKFSNGSELIATPNHKIATNRGFVELQAIAYSDKIKTWKKSHQLLSKVLHIVDIQIRRIERRESISRQVVKIDMTVSYDIIRNFGNTIRGRSLRGLSFITRIITPSTTNWITSHSSVTQSIEPIILGNASRTLYTLKNTTSGWLLLEPYPMIGSKRIKAKNIYRQMLRNLFIWKNHLHLSALVVVRSLLLIGSKKINGAAGRVRIVSHNDNLEKRNVYNLTVEGQHEYYANGILARNCHATIYMLIALSRVAGTGFGASFAEPRSGLTDDTPVSDYVDREGNLLVTAGGVPLSEKIEEAMEGSVSAEDWRYL